MVHKIIIFVMLFIYFNTTNAQLISNKFSVNFKVDEYILDDDDKRVLDDILAQAKAEKYSEISLSAHTDNDANDSYNMNLSKQRAQSVYAYLISNGIDEKTMDINWYGERKPGVQNLTENGKAYNRRVEVELRKYDLKNMSDLLKAAGGDYTQTFILEKTIENIIIGKDGTKINIPQDAFETNSGKSVPNNEVTVELQEFQKPMDAIFNNLSTICDGKILESGGMLNIRAIYNGEELKLKKNKNIAIELPSKNIKAGMQLFTGIKPDSNRVEWKQTKISFGAEKKDTVKFPTARLDEAYLKTLIQTSNGLTDFAFQDVFFITPIPIAPMIPRKPKKYNLPTENEVLNKLQKKLFSKHRKETILEKETNLREEIYNKRIVVYEKRMNYYHIALEKYTADSLAYEIVFQKFKTWVIEELEKNEKSIKLIEKQIFNQSLKSIISASEKNKLQNLDILSSLLFAKGSDMQNKQLSFYGARIDLLNWLNLMPKQHLGKLCNNNHLQYTSEIVDYYYKKDRRRGFNTYARSSVNLVAYNLLDKDPKLTEIFANYRKTILEKRAELGLIKDQDLGTIYRTAVPQIGLINCDRFYNTPSDSMINVKVKAPSKATVYYYIKNLNSMIMPSHDILQGFHTRIPKNYDITIVIMEVKKGVPQFQMLKHHVDKSVSINADTKFVKIKDMYSELAKL